MASQSPTVLRACRVTSRGHYRPAVTRDVTLGVRGDVTRGGDGSYPRQDAPEHAAICTGRLCYLLAGVAEVDVVVVWGVSPVRFTSHFLRKKNVWQDADPGAYSWRKTMSLCVRIVFQFRNRWLLGVKFTEHHACLAHSDILITWL